MLATLLKKNSLFIFQSRERHQNIYEYLREYVSLTVDQYKLYSLSLSPLKFSGSIDYNQTLIVHDTIVVTAFHYKKNKYFDWNHSITHFQKSSFNFGFECNNIP